MIDWLVRHPVVIVVIVMIVSAALRRKRAANTKASTFSPPPVARSDEQPKPVPGFDDNDDFGVGSSSEAERTRRIQEEIRRKIAERRGESTPASAAARAGDPFEVRPVPAMSPQAMTAHAKREDNESPFQRRETPAFTPASSHPTTPAVTSAQTPEVDAVPAQQRLLAETLDALDAARRAAATAGSLQAGEASTFSPAAADVGGVGWLRELRNARSLRKAIVLREVVGPPVALR